MRESGNLAIFKKKNTFFPQLFIFLWNGRRMDTNLSELRKKPKVKIEINAPIYLEVGDVFRQTQDFYFRPITIR